MAKKKSLDVKVEITSENKCSFCEGAKCCHYVTQEIDPPTTKYEFEVLAWQVLHSGVEVYKDSDKTWYIIFSTTCEKLQPNGACGIYETRPQICRDYSNDWCEYDEPADKHWLLHFPDYESIDKYCRKKFKTWGKRK